MTKEEGKTIKYDIPKPRREDSSKGEWSKGFHSLRAWGWEEDGGREGKKGERERKELKRKIKRIFLKCRVKYTSKHFSISLCSLFYFIVQFIYLRG